MKAAIDAWKRAFRVAWPNLAGVIVLNMFWFLSSLLVVTVGPATMAAYWWAAHVFRDDKEERPGSFFAALKRYFVPGLLWSLCWVVIVVLAWSNMVVYGQWLPPFPSALLRMIWLYILIYLVSMQPYLLEMLVMEERKFWESVKRSAWQVAANPVYSHFHILLPVIVAVVAYKTTTLIGILLVALLLVWWAVIAADVPWKYGERRRIEANIEDVL